jgi:hypothetical protein
VFVDNTRLVIDQNTEWVVREPSATGRTLIDLIRGAILFFARQPRSLDVKTPFVNAAVEGTEFLVRVDADRTFISVFEGHVLAKNDQGALTLARDESAVAVQGQAPQRQVVVRPRDAVQWALYYEPILPPTRSSSSTGSPSPSETHVSSYGERRSCSAPDASTRRAPISIARQRSLPRMAMSMPCARPSRSRRTIGRQR